MRNWSEQFKKAILKLANSREKYVNNAENVAMLIYLLSATQRLGY